MYHTYLTILVPTIIAFCVTTIGTKFIMGYMRESGVVALDHNKKNKPTVPSGVGIALALGFGVGILVYAAGSSFNLYVPVASIEYLFAAVIGVLLISLVGLLDDINVKREMTKSTDMMDTRKGLKQWQKPLLTLMGAIPLMAVNAGVSIVEIPFIGYVNFGILYPLIIVPLAIIFGANAFNLLGGFDGIATGTALIAAAGLLVYSLIFGTYTGSLISGVLFSTLLAFLFYNIYPSKMIPGDSFTYAVGAAMIIDMILGNMEAFGIIVFMPWIIEFILHLRKKFRVTDLGKLRNDGTFEPPYGKRIYSWTHVAMNIMRAKEWQVSEFMWAIELLFVGVALLLKYFMFF
ncbi:MAG: hypothetical protein QXN59_03245 [Candidatus Micrarchaeaceae archaeon]